MLWFGMNAYGCISEEAALSRILLGQLEVGNILSSYAICGTIFGVAE